MKRIEFDQECQSCGGTGVYVGMAERDGSAVVCQQCHGTGKFHFVHDYNEFTGRNRKPGVVHVVKTNPGICIGGDLSRFGGMPYDEWIVGKPFPAGSEMRNYVCPLWWCQCADYRKRIEWDTCEWWGGFSRCKHFANKAACWDRWDAEQARGGGK